MILVLLNTCNDKSVGFGRKQWRLGDSLIIEQRLVKGVQKSWKFAQYSTSVPLPVWWSTNVQHLCLPAVLIFFLSLSWRLLFLNFNVFVPLAIDSLTRLMQFCVDLFPNLISQSRSTRIFTVVETLPGLGVKQHIGHGTFKAKSTEIYWARVIGPCVMNVRGLTSLVCVATGGSTSQSIDPSCLFVRCQNV